MKTIELKVPPPAVTLLFAVVMWLVSFEPFLALPLPWRTDIALMFGCAGFIVALAGLFAFYQANTTVNPLTPEAATTMVTSGIYRISRNPMYLGLALALTAWAVWLSHLLPFALLPCFVLYLNRFQIEPEERALAAKFGGQFTAYAQAVRRWL